MEPEACVHKRPTHVPIPSLISPVCILLSYFLEVYFNVILLSVPRFSKLSDLGFPTKTMYVLLICHMPTHYILLHFVTQIIFGENNTS